MGILCEKDERSTDLLISNILQTSIPQQPIDRRHYLTEKNLISQFPTLNNQKILKLLAKLGPFQYTKDPNENKDLTIEKLKEKSKTHKKSNPQLDSPEKETDGKISTSSKEKVKDYYNEKLYQDYKIYQLNENEIYVGEWLNNQRNGKGKNIWLDKQVYYEGNWLNDQKSGYGRMIFENGDVYEGDWFEDKYEGKGIYYFYDSSKYEGNFKNNQFNGFGVYNWLEGRVYKGEWLNNLKHGQGEYIWCDNRKYEGAFEFNYENGFGIFQFTDGTIYKGYWINGRTDLTRKYEIIEKDVYS